VEPGLFHGHLPLAQTA